MGLTLLEVYALTSLLADGEGFSSASECPEIKDNDYRFDYSGTTAFGFIQNNMEKQFLTLAVILHNKKCVVLASLILAQLYESLSTVFLENLLKEKKTLELLVFAWLDSHGLGQGTFQIGMP
ncbi:hypothetical protein PIB30_076551 [Stylosanthes scabra]|uniref:Uncharacterized protein n=1 Tax=Stylosanthes scabra TaxID=79078 RepID=A0ABU6VQ25_9FABA|nr:hypothetical protein [Stylosanthes scabra]